MKRDAKRWQRKWIMPLQVWLKMGKRVRVLNFETIIYSSSINSLRSRRSMIAVFKTIFHNHRKSIFFFEKHCSIKKCNQTKFWLCFNSDHFNKITNLKKFREKCLLTIFLNRLKKKLSRELYKKCVLSIILNLLFLIFKLN